MEEVGFWLNGYHMSDHCTILDTEASQQFTGVAMVKSCIFYNFFDQCRLGVNGTLIMEKCHMSECRSYALHAVNPKTVKVLTCTISKPMKTGILIQWLKDSDNTDKCRMI